MKRLLVVGAIAVAILIALKLWYSAALKPVGGGQAAISVGQGSGAAAIAADLQQAKLIKSPTAFKLHVKLNNLASDFKAGRYVVSGNDSTPTIATGFTDSSKASNQFTIPEGLTQKQVAAQLGKLGLVDEEEFANLKAKDFEYDFLAGAPEDASLEGFLFPETYTIPPEGTSARDVATIFLNQFGKELTTQMRADIQAKGRTIYQTVTVASMVEEEVRSDKDRKLVAGVMYRRLADDIRLDIDATTRYALGKTNNETLTAKDLDSNDPYNTRKVKGLPPGPICSPGLNSLEAAIYPEASEYLFYLSAPDGTTFFAKTNAEHEQNKSEHLK